MTVDNKLPSPETELAARIVRLKLAIAWFVPVLAAAGLWLCGFFCNAVVDAAFSEELAACCGLSCVFLSMISTIWVSARLDALENR